MQNRAFTNVRTGKLSLRTFVIFGIILLVAVGITWWLTKKNYDKSVITDYAFTQIDSSLKKSINVLEQYNREELWKMENKMNKIVFREKFMIWKPKMDSTFSIASRIKRLFEYSNSNLINSKRENDEAFSTTVIFLQHISDSLRIYRELLSSFIPADKQQYLQDLSLDKFLKLPVSDTLFYNLSKAGQMSLLNKIKFDALLSTNIMITFINDQNTYYDESYDRFDVLIGQNTTYLLPGQTLEISAGLGAYASYAKPKIVIDGKEQTLNSYGGAAYKKVVSANEKGFIPISVSFKDPMTGQTVIKETRINYTVLKPLRK